MTPPHEPRTADLRRRVLGLMKVNGKWVGLGDRTPEGYAAEQLDALIDSVRAEAAGAPLREALNTLDEMIEGTEPDRIGQYEPLKKWVHRKAKEIRATLAATPAPVPLDVGALVGFALDFFLPFLDYPHDALQRQQRIDERMRASRVMFAEYARLTARAAAAEDTE